MVGSLNIRGGGSRIKRRGVSHIIKKGKADIFLIQETKLPLVSHSVAKSFWGSEGFDFSLSSSEGMLGGLLIIWKSFGMEVLCSFKVFKRELWRNLLRLKSSLTDGDWLIGGDFNAVKDREERVSRTISSNNIENWEFSKFIDDSMLVDVPLKGNNSLGLLEMGRDILDHCPIWLVLDRDNSGPKPFKCNNEWFSNKDFIPFVEKEWKAIQVYGRGDFILEEKFRIIKERLRWWNSSVFGKLDLEIEESVRVMNIEVHEEDGGLEELTSYKMACGNFWLNLKIKENMLIQKSRIKWINDGGSNNRYFHSIMKERRRRNHIGPLNSDRGVLVSVEDVKEEVRNFFGLKFDESEVSRSVLDGVLFDKLGSIERSSLEAPFSEEEIKEAVWSCDGLKSPGPDGFSFHFIKNC
ncbi:uncharacterized protein LOC131619457 [Vicia villosa]|uniref:uncharacterized protein LOC131619457 n=1 Tax=Vicia villosa TaxID=3911 RepID=UPI00273A8D67|nr:uncharacterized protein LOC131619457 [Vicia villosa]